MGAVRPSAWLPGKARKWRLAFGQLLEAHAYSKDLKRPIWDFAVEWDRLVAAGLTPNDLRWLVAKGYVELAAEVGTSGICDRRAFRASKKPRLPRRCCVVLTKSGIEFANRALSMPSEPDQWCPKINGNARNAASTVPHWDAARRTLFFGSNLVKQFKVPAFNQELVLAAFHEEGWPATIDDPLPPQRGIDPKGRLHDTIIRLNRSHISAVIRFHGNGNGLAVHWEQL